MNSEYFEQTKEAYIAQECEAFGHNESGGLKYDSEANQWVDHCQGYEDELSS